MRGLGLRNIGIVPLRSMGLFLGGLVPFDFDPALAVFTASKAKRTSSGAFATGPIIQGKADLSGVSDELSMTRGNQVHGDFYTHMDGNQSGITCEYIPEFNSADRTTGDSYIYYLDSDNYLLYDWDNAQFELSVDGQTITRAQALTAGTLVFLDARWQSTGTLDGSNYAALGVNDTPTYGVTTAPSITPSVTTLVGSTSAPGNAADGIVSGWNARRVPWFDGSVGVSLIYDASGPLDELADIYNGGAMRDPALTNNGSWDFPVFLPTNCTAGALATGPGNAWSHPSLSNEIPHGWCEDGFYGGGSNGVLGNGSNTTVIACAPPNVACDDMPNGANGWTYDFWLRAGETPDVVAYKGDYTTNGWQCFTSGDDSFVMRIRCATTAAYSQTGSVVADGKCHHIVVAYKHTAVGGDGKVYISVDGKWESSYATQTASVGAYITDAAQSLSFGYTTVSLDGLWGWQRFTNTNTRFTVGTDFIPPRAKPANDGTTIGKWGFADGTGAAVISDIAMPADDGVLANGTWEVQWDQAGTPVEFHGVEFNGTTTSGVIPDAGAIQDLHAADMTIDLYVRLYSRGEGNQGRLLDKSAINTKGWQALITANGFGVQAFYAGGTASTYCGVDEYTWDGKLHLLSAQLDFASRTWYQWIDGIPVASYHEQNAGAGIATTDVGENLFVGNNSGGSRTTDGMLGGWLRVSSTGRYTLGEAFVPNDPFNPPGTDANTAWQADYSDGAGATLTDDSAGANNCTLTNYDWLNSFDMTEISPGSGIYGGQGYIVGADAPNDGTIVTFTGLTPRTDCYLHTVGHPGPDSRGDLNLLVYDETNAANITSFNLCRYTGTHTGGAASPVLVAPAGSFSQRMVGAVCWNIDDGSFGTINAVSGDGTTASAPLGGGGSNDWQNGEVYRITWSQLGSVGNPTDRYPNVEEFGFELPALCTSISITARETSGEGAWWLHQAIWL